MMENELNLSSESIDINDSISLGLPSRPSRAIVPDVLPCKNLREALQYILYYNISQGNNETFTEDQEQIFEIIEQLREHHPQKMFMYLRKHFAKHFDIDLQIVAFDNGKFSLFNKDNYNKETMAFLSFDKDNTVHGPLYITNIDGTMETIFSSNDNDICIDVYMYVAQLNEIKPSIGVPQMQEQEGVHCATEWIENSSNQINFINPVPVDDKTQSRIVLDQTLQQIFRIIDGLPIDSNILRQVLQPFVSHVSTFQHLSPQDTIVASKDVINYFSLLIQLAEQAPDIYQNEQIIVSQVPFASDINSQNVEMQNDSTTIDGDNSTSETSIDISNNYYEPTLNKLLNSPFHPRNLKEFSQTKSSPIQCEGSGQRDRLQITVPSTDMTQLYIAMKLVDIDDETHASKIIVPNKTKVQNEPLMNNNDLTCLNFNECEEVFDRETKTFYAPISLTERQKLQKEMRVHLINLYQRGEVKRKMIEKKHLKKCKLAFWFCEKINNKYQRASPISYSNVIEESMTNPNKKRTKVANKNRKRLSRTTINVH